MKPVLGWTMLSWEEMRQVERALASGEQDTRDEIGFLLIHQGFADRFFPGTSVLHTRVRYALFVPWLYLRAAHNRLWINQEQNRDAARFGATGERQSTGQSAAGLRGQGMTAFRH